MTNKKSIYYIILFFSLFCGIFFNKQVLKIFTIDNEINDFNLLFISNFLSIFFLLIFLFFIFYFNRKEKIIFFINQKKREIIILFISIFFSFFLIEVFLSIFKSSMLKNVIVNFKAVEFQAQYAYNNFGYRDENFQKEKKDEYRVFLIGDSFVHGSAVDSFYTFDKIIETELKNDSKKVNIFNLGIPGTGLSSYLKTLKKFKKFKPDSIFIFLYLDNDIVTDNKIGFLLTSLSQLLNKSEILKLIKNISGKNEYFFSDEYLDKFNLKKEIKKSFKEQKLNIHQLALVYRGNYHLYYNNLVEIFRDSQNDKKKIIEIKKISEELNSKLYFVIIPSKYQVKIEYQKFPKEQFGMKFGKGLIDNNLQKEVIKFLSNNAIPSIDLLPYLRKSKIKNYYTIDEHFNKYGNKLTSYVIIKSIKKDLNKND